MNTLLLKPYCLLFLLFLFSREVHAQQTYVSGYLLDSLTHLPLSGGTVRNATTGQKIRTGIDGFFRLGVKPDDLLYVLAPDHRFDTLHYSLLFQDTIQIYLAPSEKMLEGVTVSGYRQYQRDSLQRRGAFEEAKGNSPAVFSRDPSLGFGLALNLDRFFKKRYKNKVRAERSFNYMEKEAYIDFRFPPTTVSLYTGLKGEALLDFMYRYRPSYEWLRAHPSRENMIDYLNESLKAYRRSKSPAGQK